jgi:Protein of unknown function (DUF3592)
MNFIARNGTYLALLSIGAAIVLLVAVLLVRRRIAFLKIRNAPLTPAEAFRKYKPPLQPTEVARPSLTSSGRWTVILAAVWGLIWVGVTVATLHSFLMDYRFANEAQTVTGTVLSTRGPREYSNVQYEFQLNGRTYRGFGDDRNMRSSRRVGKSFQLDVSYLPSDPTKNRPAGERPLNIFQGLLPCAFLALIAFLPFRQLRRDLILARMGRPTTGIVVGVVYGQRSYSIWVYYDFADDHGGVRRGKASLTGNYWQAAAGSPIPVLYLPGNPTLNNLKLAMCWQ